MDATKLEPAERNFKREVMTLVITLVIALGAGGVILYNYMKTVATQREEELKGRAPELSELSKNYSFKNKNDEKASFFDYTGHVTLVACIAVNQLEDSQVVIDTLKGFAERYKDEPRVRILLLSMDDEQDLPVEKVVPVLTEAGLAGEKWDIALSNGSKFLAYVKNQVKFLSLRVDKRNDKWLVPLRVRVIGPDLKIRGNETEYNFGKYQADTAEAREYFLKEENKAEARLLEIKEWRNDPSKIDFVEYAIGTMNKNIDYMLENEEFDKHKIDENKKKNIYKPFLWLFGAFGVFLLILWLKTKRKQPAEAK